MYLGVDIGGTKTLVAAIDDNGVIKKSLRFKTNNDYALFSADLVKHLQLLGETDFKAGAVGLPASLMNAERSKELKFSNLNWHNINIKRDLERMANCPIVADNDAKLAALSEAMLLKDKYIKVLYITISTGIGFALVNNLKIDENIGDGGGKTILLEHRGKTMPWEDFASGKAIVNLYGKKAKDITDKPTWQRIGKDLAKGIIHLIAVTEPEVIVVGGSVGVYFDRYKEPLDRALQSYKLPILTLPKIIKAQRPEDAVLYGCYDIAKQRFSK